MLHTITLKSWLWHGINSLMSVPGGRSPVCYLRTGGRWEPLAPSHRCKFELAHVEDSMLTFRQTHRQMTLHTHSQTDTHKLHASARQHSNSYLNSDILLFSRLFRSWNQCHQAKVGRFVLLFLWPFASFGYPVAWRYLHYGGLSLSGVRASVSPWVKSHKSHFKTPAADCTVM